MKLILYKNKLVTTFEISASRLIWQGFFIHRKLSWNFMYFDSNLNNIKISPNFDYINKYILFNKK